MYIWNGTESPKKFITWQLNIQMKIINKEYTKMKYWHSIFNNILKCTDKSMKVILNQTHVLQEGQNDIVHGNITQIKDIKTLTTLNIYIDQDALRLYIITFEF